MASEQKVLQSAVCVASEQKKIVWAVGVASVEPLGWEGGVGVAGLWAGLWGLQLEIDGLGCLTQAMTSNFYLFLS